MHPDTCSDAVLDVHEHMYGVLLPDVTGIVGCFVCALFQVSS